MYVCTDSECYSYYAKSEHLLKQDIKKIRCDLGKQWVVVRQEKRKSISNGFPAIGEFYSMIIIDKMLWIAIGYNNSRRL